MSEGPLKTAVRHLKRVLSAPATEEWSDQQLLDHFARERDESAFACLVRRHGALVLGVSRRVLQHDQDAEDVFQASFLILARKAASRRWQRSIAGWLYCVAHRLAVRARARIVRQRRLERQAGAQRKAVTEDANELYAALDEELECLRDQYREPLLLCYLEGKTRDQAARQLGWPLRTLERRLEQGLKLLRARLTRRGIELSAALLAAGLSQQAAAAAVSASVLAAAVEMAGTFSSGAVLAGAVPSARVVTLARGGMKAMAMSKLKTGFVVLVAAGVLAAGLGELGHRLLGTEPPKETQAAQKVLAPPPPPAPVSAEPPVHRDQAGDPLPAEALSRLGTTRFRQGGTILNLAFAPDGKTLVSCSRHGDGVRFWNTATGQEIQRFPEQTDARGIALSPDGELLAVRLSFDNPKEEAIAIREFATGRLLRRFGDGMTPWSIRFSPDGKVLAAFWATLDIELWDPASGRRLGTLKGHERVVSSVAFSRNSKTLVSGSHDQTIRFWDIATGKELRQIKLNNVIGEIAVSSDGKLLASIELIPQVNEVFGGTVLLPDNQVRLWEADTGKELHQLTISAKKKNRRFRTLSFSPDGKMLLTAGDGTLRFWDPVTGKELREITGLGSGLGALSIAPDGNSLAIVDGSSTIRLLDFSSGKDRVPSLGHRNRVSSISVLPDGQTIATIGQDGTLRFWESATGRQLRQRAVSVDFTVCSGLRPDGRTYLTVGEDDVCRLNDLASGQELAVLHGHQSPFPFALSPDGKTLASVNTEKVVRLLDSATGAVRHTLTKVKQRVWGMTFTANGRTLVVWDADFIVTLWDAATGKLLKQFTAAESGIPAPFMAGRGFFLYNAELSPDGRLLAFGIQVIGSKEKILPVVETTSGKVVIRFSTAEDGASKMAFSPDGKSLAWGGNLGTTVYLGELASGRIRQRFVGHTGYIGSLAFSPDGKMLISGSNDTTALIWDLTGRLAMGEKFGSALSAEELETYWKTLAAEDAEAAYRAVQALAADPVRSVPYLRQRLHPVALVDEKRIQRWIADLDSGQFTVREKATVELEKLEASALHDMRNALAEKSTLEKRRRLKQLIEKQEREEWSPSSDSLRSRRTLEVLERAGTVEAKDVLTILASGAPGARKTLEAKVALERLAVRPAGKR